jgi:uncharacterized protein YjiS (DUF1127 family)
MLTQIFKGLAKWWSDWRALQRVSEELSRLDDRSLADIGITRSEIPYLLTRRPEAEAPAAKRPVGGLRHAA